MSPPPIHLDLSKQPFFTGHHIGPMPPPTPAAPVSTGPVSTGNGVSLFTVSGPGSTAPVIGILPAADSMAGRFWRAAREAWVLPGVGAVNAVERHVLDFASRSENQRVLVHDMAALIRNPLAGETQRDQLRQQIEFWLGVARRSRGASDTLSRNDRAYALSVLLRLHGALVEPRGDLATEQNVQLNGYVLQILGFLDRHLAALDVHVIFGAHGEYIPSIEDSEAPRFFEMLRTLASVNPQALVYARRLQLEEFLGGFLHAHHRAFPPQTSIISYASIPAASDSQLIERDGVYLRGALAVLSLDRELELGVVRGMAPADVDHLVATLAAPSHFPSIDERIRDLLRGRTYVPERPISLPTTGPLEPDQVLALASLAEYYDAQSRSGNLALATAPQSRQVREVLKALDPSRIVSTDAGSYLRAIAALASHENTPADDLMRRMVEWDPHACVELVRLENRRAELERISNRKTFSKWMYRLLFVPERTFTTAERFVPAELRGTLREVRELRFFASRWLQGASELSHDGALVVRRLTFQAPLQSIRFMNTIKRLRETYQERLDEAVRNYHLSPGYLPDPLFNTESILRDVIRDPRLNFLTEDLIGTFTHLEVRRGNDLGNDLGEDPWMGWVNDPFADPSSRRTGADIAVPRTPTQHAFEKLMISLMVERSSRESLAHARLIMPFRVGDLQEVELMQVIDFLERAVSFPEVEPGNLIRLHALETLLLMRAYMAVPYRTLGSRLMNSRGDAEIAVIDRLDQVIARVNPYTVVGREGECLPHLMSGDARDFVETMRSFVLLNPRSAGFVADFDWNRMLMDLSTAVVQLRNRAARPLGVLAGTGYLSITEMRYLETIQEIVYLDQAVGRGRLIKPESQDPNLWRHLRRMLAMPPIDADNRRLTDDLRYFFSPQGNDQATIQGRNAAAVEVAGSLRDRLTDTSRPLSGRFLVEAERFFDAQEQRRVMGESVDITLETSLGNRLAAFDPERLDRRVYADVIVGFGVLARYGNMTAAENLLFMAGRDPNAFEASLRLLVPHRETERYMAVTPVQIPYGLLRLPEAMYQLMDQRIYRLSPQLVTAYESLMERRSLALSWLDQRSHQTEIPHLRLRPLRFDASDQDVAAATTFLDMLDTARDELRAATFEREHPMLNYLNDRKAKGEITEAEYRRQLQADRRPLAARQVAEVTQNVWREIGGRIDMNRFNSLTMMADGAAVIQQRSASTAPSTAASVIATGPLTSHQANPERDLTREPSTAERVLDAVQRSVPDPLHSEGREGRGRR